MTDPKQPDKSPLPEKSLEDVLNALFTIRWPMAPDAEPSDYSPAKPDVPKTRAKPKVKTGKTLPKGALSTDDVLARMSNRLEARPPFRAQSRPLDGLD